MIYILWPTVRPQMMMATFKHWLANADDASCIDLSVAVNTQSQKDEIGIQGANIHVVGTKKGLTTAVNWLSTLVDGDPADILVLASDDVYAPPHWDSWITEALTGKVGCIHVNDGYHKQENITIPIMNVACLRRLNNIIYHPSYIHQFSDTELYHNLVDLGLLIDAWNRSPVFEHKNWACKKRKIDEHDRYNIEVVNIDAQNWHARRQLPVEQRLKK